MSTATAPATSAPASPSIPKSAHVSFLGAVRSEWLKLRTLRSTWWIAGLTVVIMAGIALLGTWSLSTFIDADPEGAAQAMGVMPNGAEFATSGSLFGQLVLGVLGVLVVTNEYASGMVRSTFAAVPRRTPVVLAKVVVLTLISLVTSAVAIGASALVSMPFFDTLDVTIPMDSADTWQILGGVAVFLTLIALMSFGFGLILRHTAGAIFTVVAIAFVIPLVLQAFQTDLIQNINKFLPMNASTAFTTTTDAGAAGMELLDPWVGFAVMVAWAVVPIAVGTVLLKSRDV
ncbi:ABC-2 family transporter protein [Paraoerskovia marina]|uniref:ABC-2 family transporter protein n=1 Tax=Paraoerskovia marina TaxID=545619 RepID=A0A1H1QKC4_9CELL|nr:ABC transporter permease subunit [Paraoerskovia marina]SDS23845.1 ABC-2 family transporter protein [Paraoerskovia marina]